MEKFSSLDRFIDKKTTKEDAKILLADISTDLTLKGKEPLDYEIEKSSEQIEICNILNDYTNKILNKYGIDNFDISPDNIHIFDSRLQSEGMDIGGQFIAEDQSILVRNSGNKLSFAHYLSHEIIHLKSHGTVQVIRENSESFDLDFGYRSGFKMKSRDGKREFFHKIDEALTEELSKEITQDIKKNNNPIFQNQIKETDEVCEGFFVASGSEDIVYAERFKDDDPRKGEYLVFAEEYAYVEERRILKLLIAKICQKTERNYREIFELFVKGKLKGNIFELAKLIDANFGEGTFRKLGEVSNLDDNKEFDNFVQEL